MFCKKAAVVLLCCCLSGCSAVSPRVKKVYIQPEDMDKVEVPSHKFRTGETLKYKIKWMGISVGEAVLKVDDIVDYNGRKAYHIIAEARTSRVLDKIYKIEDRIETYMDVEGLYAHKFVKKQCEGRYCSDEQVLYDHINGVGHYTSLKNKTEKSFDIVSYTQDALSCLYYFRTQDVEVGKPVYVNVNADEKNWEVKVDVLEASRIRLKGIGEFQAVLIEPITQLQGIAIRKGRLTAWVSTDKNRYPLIIQTEAPIIGKAVATLVSVE